MFCRFCGTRVNENANFCKCCGRATIRSASPTASSGQPTPYCHSTGDFPGSASPSVAPPIPPQPYGYTPYPPQVPGYPYPQPPCNLYVYGPAPHENWEPAPPAGAKGSWVFPVSAMSVLALVGIALFFTI